MPANEQGLVDHISIWGRRRIILNKSGPWRIIGSVQLPTFNSHLFTYPH